jgi:hypothetical protein
MERKRYRWTSQRDVAVETLKSVPLPVLVRKLGYTLEEALWILEDTLTTPDGDSKHGSTIPAWASRLERRLSAVEAKLTA